MTNSVIASPRLGAWQSMTLRRGWAARLWIATAQARLAMTACFAFTLSSYVAYAEDRPLTQPTRDVDVIYRIAGPDGPLEQRLRWGVTLGKLRVDPPSPGLYMIIDQQTHIMQAVREADRSVVQVDGGDKALPGAAPGGRFTKGEVAQIQGLPCTLWQTNDLSGRKVSICMTSDGVMLRAEADGLVLAEATAVKFAPLGEAVFRVPSNYRKIMPAPVSRKP